MPYFGDGSNLSSVPGVPVGGIIMWSGATNNIPSGWALCDGNNGTPNLQDKFIVGAGSSYAVAATGGSANAVVIQHNHGINDPGHQHTWSRQDAQNDVGYRPWPASNNDCAQRNINTSGSGSHSHSISGTTGNPSNTGTNSQGSSATNANLPPYYALAYIMKT